MTTEIMDLSFAFQSYMRCIRSAFAVITCFVRVYLSNLLDNIVFFWENLVFHAMGPSDSPPLIFRSLSSRTMASSLVSKATAEDQHPVSGFLLKELADLTNTSAKESENVRHALLGRLEKSSPDVKLKALRAIKYIAQHGSADFRIAFQRDIGSVKNHQRTFVSSWHDAALFSWDRGLS